MTDSVRPQRRGRKIAMTPAELNEFLAEQRTCRIATISADGPHATPLWFGWDTVHLWLYSIVRSQRWVDLTKDPRLSAVIDTGTEYLELRGVEIQGSAEIVGEVPRGDTVDTPLTDIESQFARKYFGVDRMYHDGRHGWLRVTPTKISSWDFRKLGAQ